MSGGSRKWRTGRSGGVTINNSYLYITDTGGGGFAAGKGVLVEDGTRKRYKIICPYCGKVQYACKSIFRETGNYDLGHGTCIKCDGMMRLVYDPEYDTMEAGEWETA